MKIRQGTSEHQELENQPGLANHASGSDLSSRSSKPKDRPEKKEVLRERNKSRSRSKKKGMEDRKVLFDITVEVEDGREVQIQMREGDSAEAVATKFCEEQNLSSQLVLPLTEHIVNNIVTVSKQDKDIMLCFDDDRCRHHNARYGHELLEEYENRRRIIERERHDFPTRRARTGPRRPARQRRISERLLSSTLSSARKGSKANFEPPKTTRKPTELSEREKAISMRLHGYLEVYNQNREEERKMHMDSYRKHMERTKPRFSKKSRRMMKIREMTAKQFKNYGELLYWEALSSMQVRKKLVEMGQEEKMKSEVEGLTWKPNISKMAQRIKRRAGEVWERLQSDKRNEVKFQALRKQAAANELMECTFKPQINTSTPAIEELSLGSVSRFDLLFWDAESRRKRQQRYTLWFPEGLTFQPFVNKRVDERPPSGSEENVKSRDNVFTRLMGYAAKLTSRKRKAIDDGKVPTDSATGDKLFTPRTGRPPHQRNREGLPISEFLYRLRTSNEARKQSLAEEYFREWKALVQSHHLSSMSQELSRRFEQRTLHQLFDYLDEDKDGYVDLKTAPDKGLTSEVKQTIAEAEKDPQAVGPLPIDKFLEVMLRAQSKRRNGLHLILSNWKKRGLQKLTWRFRMGKRSRELAAGRRNFSSHDQWYTIILSDMKKLKSKIEALRRDRESKEISQCSFKPATLASPGISRFRDPERLHVEERGEDDVHGYIFKETVRGSQAAESTTAAPAGTTQSESGSETQASSGLFGVWKRFVARPPEERDQVKDWQLSLEVTAN